MTWGAQSVVIYERIGPNKIDEHSDNFAKKADAVLQGAKSMKQIAGLQKKKYSLVRTNYKALQEQIRTITHQKS